MTNAADDADPRGTVWRIMEEISVCMLTTRNGLQLRARPMAARLREQENLILFLTDVNAHKDEDIAHDPHVCVSFTAPDGSAFLAVSGEALVVNDHAIVRDIWTSDDAAWWEGPDDERIRVLSVALIDAQYWTNPGSASATVAMAGSATSRNPIGIGETQKVDLQ